MVSFGLEISPFFAFQQSDFFGRFIVFCLVITSVVSWTIIIDKWLYLRLVKKQSREFLNFVKKMGAPVELFLHLDSFKGPLHGVSKAGVRTLAGIMQRHEDELLADIKVNRVNLSMSDVDCELLASTFEEAVDTEIVKMEKNLGLLGSIVSSSPFLGLLGTVWGVMMAFCGMALKGKADINAIAPGVSGALLTTVVALMVAIPALIGYNQLSGIVKELTLKFDHFAHEFVTLLKKHYCNHVGDG